MWRPFTKAASAAVVALMMLGLSAGTAAAQDLPQLPNGECFELVTVLTDSLVPGPEYTDGLVLVSSEETILNTVPCGDDDEVLSIVETPDDVLAFTGSSVNTPVTVGFSLLGAGGLALYAARRRTERDQQAQLAKDFDELELV